MFQTEPELYPLVADLANRDGILLIPLDTILETNLYSDLACSATTSDELLLLNCCSSSVTFTPAFVFGTNSGIALNPSSMVSIIIV